MSDPNQPATPTTDWQRLSEGDVNQSDERQRFLATRVGEHNQHWLERDAEVFMHQSLSTPCLSTLESAHGIYLTDVDGRRYIDFHGNSVHQLGYGHPAIIQAATQAMSTLPFSPRRFTNRYTIELAEQLSALTQGQLSRVLFAPGGTSAIGMALKVAQLYTHKHQTLSLWESFHGASLDAIAIGGEQLFRAGLGPFPDAHHVPPCDPQDCGYRCQTRCTGQCADAVAAALERHPQIGAVIIETIRCTDVQIPPKEYYQKIRQSCDRHGALLILDEIPIGLGRTGKMFAFEHYGIVPDMLVLGKGLGGGLWPMAALLAHARLNIGQNTAIGHYTHEKSSVGSAIALATLKVIADDNLCERAVVIGEQISLHLKAVSLPWQLQVRAIGALVGIEITHRDGRKAFAIAEKVLYRCLSTGLSFKIGQGNVLTLVPPLTISDSELTDALTILINALEWVAERYQ